MWNLHGSQGDIDQLLVLLTGFITILKLSNSGILNKAPMAVGSNPSRMRSRMISMEWLTPRFLTIG